MKDIKSVHCCYDRGPEGKISKDLNAKVGQAYAKSEMALRLAMNDAGEAFGMKGAFVNIESEGLLRECTGIRGGMSYLIQFFLPH